MSRHHAAFDGIRFLSDLTILRPFLCYFECTHADGHFSRPMGARPPISFSARRRMVFLSLKKIWLIGKSPYLRYWGKRPIPGFSGFSPLHPFHSIFSQSIKYQQVAQNMSKKVLITGGVPIQPYKGSNRGQKAVISKSATPTPASFTLVCSVCNLLQLWPYFGLENAHYAPWGFF